MKENMKRKLREDEEESKTSLHNNAINNCFLFIPLPVYQSMHAISGSELENHPITGESEQHACTKEPSTCYDQTRILKKPYVIGICGGSASGKTTVANRIVKQLEVPWVTVLPMDSFYKVLTEEEHDLASRNEYNFDEPRAFDFDLIYKTLQRLREGKNVAVPVYNFITHRREEQWKLMHASDVLIFEGILAFHDKELVNAMDIKVFVDTDSDIRLARRLVRDVEGRGRNVDDVLKQYFQFVKPAFETFVERDRKIADIIIPGYKNDVAIDHFVRQINTQLAKRRYDAAKKPYLRSSGMTQNDDLSLPLPQTLTVMSRVPQIRCLQAFLRNCKTSSDEFPFYSNKLMRILIECVMNSIPSNDKTITAEKFMGEQKIASMCAITIMRAGKTMEYNLSNAMKDCKMGKISIGINEETMEPELINLYLPENIHRYKVLLIDATVNTGAVAMMAIRALLNQDIPEENILFVSLFMTRTGVRSLASTFPKVTFWTSSVDLNITELCSAIKIE